MSFQAFRNLIARGELIGSAVLATIGFPLIALDPAKQLASASAAKIRLTSAENQKGNRIDRIAL